MFVAANADRLWEIFRYYQVGLINTLFGSLLYVALVYVGFNLYIAQIISHLIGMTFNYFMFKFHVFRGVQPKLVPYVVSYGFNYLLSVAILAATHTVIESPYLAGVATMAAVSVVNYFVLKNFVFGRKNTKS